MISYCVDVGGVPEQRDGPARKSLASGLGEGRGLGGRRGGGRGILRESVGGGMAGCSEATSLSALSVCLRRCLAEAGVAYWLLPRKKTQRKESEMDVRFPWAWLLAEWSTKLVPLTGPMGERYGEGIEGSAIGPSGSPFLLIKLAVGVIFFASSQFANGRRLVGEVMERGFRPNRRSRDRRADLG